MQGNKEPAACAQILRCRVSTASSNLFHVTLLVSQQVNAQGDSSLLPTNKSNPDCGVFAMDLPCTLHARCLFSECLQTLRVNTTPAVHAPPPAEPDSRCHPEARPSSIVSSWVVHFLRVWPCLYPDMQRHATHRIEPVLCKCCDQAPGRSVDQSPANLNLYTLDQPTNSPINKASVRQQRHPYVNKASVQCKTPSQAHQKCPAPAFRIHLRHVKDTCSVPATGYSYSIVIECGPHREQHDRGARLFSLHVKSLQRSRDTSILHLLTGLTRSD